MMSKVREKQHPTKTITLGDQNLTLASIEAISKGMPITLAPRVKSRLLASRQLVEKLIHKGSPIYGINTGFGYFARHTLEKKSLLQLQKNILMSHAAGYGPALSLKETRVAMCLRLNVLAQGYTGVRYKLCECLLRLIQAEIFPLIPAYGSVGASGDLIPLAHLALPLIGMGEVHYRGKICPSKFALAKEGLKPITLAEKEGLALINGTQIMLAVGGLALIQARKLLKMADWLTALSFEALLANPKVLDSKIHAIRAQKGQIISAKRILKHLEGSYLFSSRTSHLRLQDPYSLRCAPQVHGPSIDAIEYACKIAEKEINGVTDNPLVFVEEGELLSGGNFHGQAIALAFDFAAIALSEIGNIADRRLELLMNPHMSGLPAFLAPKEGLDSGYMALQYLSASLVNENKLAANPSSTDSIPGNVGIEDHVSMGMASSHKLKRIVENVTVILAAEMIAAAQALDLRKERPLAYSTQRLYQRIRKVIPPLKSDRLIDIDIRNGKQLLESML